MGKKGNIICVCDTPNQQMTVKKDKSEERWVDGHASSLKLSGSRDDKCYVN